MKRLLQSMVQTVTGVLQSGRDPSPRPEVDKNLESSIRNLYLIGDLAGAPVIKYAMEQGHRVIEHIAQLPDAQGSDPDVYDVLICGAGAAGLNAALQAKERNLRCVVLEKGKIANTIEEFPEGKWIYAEPESQPPTGKLWLDGALKEDLVSRWHSIIRENGLHVRPEEGVEAIRKDGDGTFSVKTAQDSYRARRVVMAIGKRGNPRKLGVPGEDLEKVYHRLYNPRHYHDEDILVVGGGNSAIEAALTLSERNRVTLSYRQAEFYRIFKDNRRKLDEAVAAGGVQLLMSSEVRSFSDGQANVELQRDGRAETVTLNNDHAFVLIGAELPTSFLKTTGIRLENEWTGTRYLALGLSFLVVYSVYGLTKNLWPFSLFPPETFRLLDRPPAFWYTVLYTVVMTAFGIQAMKRWGWERKDKFQIWRYVSLLGFQWVFFFLIPEFLFRYLQSHPHPPSFAAEPWRSYGIVYAWPLFFYTFLGDPDRVWVIWGVVLTFGLVPLLVLWHGKRYCSWICGCGGLAETLGDRWRHYAPKGKASIRWEAMNLAVLVAAVVITAAVLLRDVAGFLAAPADRSRMLYSLIVDTWLVGILPVTLYPFLGGKVWCRYWCPLAKLMQIWSGLYGKFQIASNNKCIACGECSRNCQVGIDVMSFALKQENITNKNSSCIGCGICVTVCPMDVLSFGKMQSVPLVQIQAPPSG